MRRREYLPALFALRTAVSRLRVVFAKAARHLDSDIRRVQRVSIRTGVSVYCGELSPLSRLC